MIHFDERRDLVIPGDEEKTIQFCVKQFIDIGLAAIVKKGFYTVALSGGSTPKAIFEFLCKPEHSRKLDWSKVLLFWSDERSVGPEDPNSNYKMAMDAGFKGLPLKKENIFRMVAEKNIEENAQKYEKLILEKIPNASFDLVMLGMGDDGHTASLFPHTKALENKDRLVLANEVQEKKTWRMTFTYKCINQAQHISIYLIGKKKADMIFRALKTDYDPFDLPIQAVGTKEHKAIWIMDSAAAEKIIG